MRTTERQTQDHTALVVRTVEITTQFTETQEIDETVLQVGEISQEQVEMPMIMEQALTVA